MMARAAKEYGYRILSHVSDEKYGHSSWLSGDNPFGYQFEERKRRSRRKLIVLRHSWPLKKIRHFDSDREACSQ